MKVILELPEDVARNLAPEGADPARAALEAIAIEGVRSGRISTGQARRLLGFATGVQVDGFLKDHGVYLPLAAEDVEAEAEVSRRFRETWSSQTPRR